MKLYNSATKKKEDFKPTKKTVGVYSCGPTVYWNQHIGHMYAYVVWDTLVRYLRYRGHNVKWVMNITDVGHLTSDADFGEDKMEKGAKREGLTVWQIAEKYTDQFLESMDYLNIVRPDVISKATEHIQEQIEVIKKIEKRGFTYNTKTGLVFNTSKFPDYAKFANLDLAKQKPGARVKVDEEKKHPEDFLLWVTNQPDHVMQWDSPWGKGYPGWHIECTAMSTKYLGEKFDIHTGGREHIPVHHTNEIAQSYVAFGGHSVNFWLHNEWLTVKNTKMSKSLGNFYTVGDLINKGYDPLVLRYLILTSYYRKGLVFSWESLTAAQVALEKLRSLARVFKNNNKRHSLSMEKQEKIDKYKDEFERSLDDDLNTPKAIASLWGMVKSNIPNEDKYDLLMSFDEVLGLQLRQAKIIHQAPKAVLDLIDKREKLRKEKKYTQADEVRKEIENKGYLVKDTPKKTNISEK